MPLLDASIALVVTLAVFATLATALVELIIRTLGLKARGQVELFLQIHDQLQQGKFGHLEKTNVPSRRKFLQAMLQNPVVRSRLLESPIFDDDRSDGTDTSTAAAAPPDTDTDTDTKTKTGNPGPLWRYWFSGGHGIYDRVSHEHVLRHLLEFDGWLGRGQERLTRDLHGFVHRYDEYSAAASVRFRERMRSTSLIVSLLLAVAINIDVARLFDHYLRQPQQAEAIAAIVSASSSPPAAAPTPAQNNGAPPADGAPAAQAMATEVQALVERVAALHAAGLPIGWGYAPHCQLLDLLRQAPTGGADQYQGACVLPSDSTRGWGQTLVAQVVILATGLLIGLGAPFWFDLLRRLAQVRSMFGGASGAASDYDGESLPAGKDRAKATDDLIARVVTDALHESAAHAPSTPP